jgi:hypothetical protein
VDDALGFLLSWSWNGMEIPCLHCLCNLSGFSLVFIGRTSSDWAWSVRARLVCRVESWEGEIGLL